LEEKNINNSFFLPSLVSYRSDFHLISLCIQVWMGIPVPLPVHSW